MCENEQHEPQEAVPFICQKGSALKGAISAKLRGTSSSGVLSWEWVQLQASSRAVASITYESEGHELHEAVLQTWRPHNQNKAGGHHLGNLGLHLGTPRSPRHPAMTAHGICSCRMGCLQELPASSMTADSCRRPALATHGFILHASLHHAPPSSNASRRLTLEIHAN